MSLESKIIGKSNLIDFYDYDNSEKIIFEEELKYGLHTFILGLIFVLFGVLLAPIGVLIFLPLGFLCIYYLKKYYIYFSPTKLIIRKRLLRKSKTFELKNLDKIEIVITKRKIHYHSNSSTYYSTLKFKLKIITSTKEYGYRFIWFFHQRRNSLFGGYKEAREGVIKKRDDFEVRLKLLQNDFPNLITLTDNYPKEKELKHKKRKGQIFDIISFLLILSCIIISDLKLDLSFHRVAFLELFLFFILTALKSKNDEDSPEQEKKSIKNIIRTIFLVILAIFYTFILVAMIGYFLIFLLECLIYLA